VADVASITIERKDDGTYRFIAFEEEDGARAVCDIIEGDLKLVAQAVIDTLDVDYQELVVRTKPKSRSR
jgi:hypothetical protein